MEESGGIVGVAPYIPKDTSLVQFCLVSVCCCCWKRNGRNGEQRDLELQTTSLEIQNLKKKTDTHFFELYCIYTDRGDKRNSRHRLSRTQLVSVKEVGKRME